jgi:4,5-DOPA dioxygenase extradiol
MESPRTIHDFGGFPKELFEQQYPAPGAPALAREIAASLSAPPVGLDEREWGFDHGAWSVLKPMFPLANVPLIQLSMDYQRPMVEHFSLGQQLAKLRDLGVLIVASGNIVHHLRAMKWDAAPSQAYEWATAFDHSIAQHIQSGNLAALQDFQNMGETARLAHPTFEHFLPLLYAAGAVSGSASSSNNVRFFNSDFQGASISMRSVIWSAD